MNDIDKVLEERGKTHGDFAYHADLTQRLKKVFYQGTTQAGVVLNPVEMEAVDMILHKLGRIGSGNPHFEDHWVDIAGYASLVPRHTKDGRVKVATADITGTAMGKSSRRDA